VSEISAHFNKQRQGATCVSAQKQAQTDNRNRGRKDDRNKIAGPTLKKTRVDHRHYSNCELYVSESGVEKQTAEERKGALRAKKLC
jgi:hypothetical protein